MKASLSMENLALDKAKELVKYIIGELSSEEKGFDLKPAVVWLSDHDLLERIQERVRKLGIDLEEP